jgi:hypothetical protein
MQHHSLTQGEPQLSGEIKYAITNNNSTFNTPKRASDIQHNSFNMEFILQKFLSLQQVRKISPSFQKLWCQYLPVRILIL